MKVLHVLYQSLPNTAGSSIRSRDIICSQLKAGLTPIVITSPFQVPFKKGCKKEIIDNVTYYRTFSNSKDEIISEEKSNIFVQIKKVFRLISFTYDVYSISKRENIDVIHAHAMFFCAISAKLTSLILKMPFVYEVRSLWEERYKNYNLFSKIIFSFVTILESLSMYSSDGLIVINNALKDNISKRYILKNKTISIVPNAVDISNIKIIEK
ncbi:MAG: glycosyltransferase, partial [Flavobacteriales bacterium]